MERELWPLLSAAINDVARARKSGCRFTYDTAVVVRVYLWSVLHDRPVYWACNRHNWPVSGRPRQLPSQSTMSRRLRSPAVLNLFIALGHRMGKVTSPALIKIIDGKPLPVSRHSQDRDATFGYGAGGLNKGYKLHAVWAEGPMPIAWQVQPMTIAEPTVARALISCLSPAGYLLADGIYDRNHLYDQAARHGHQLLAPRQQPGTDLGHRRHSPSRKRSIQLLESSSLFGSKLFAYRRRIEHHFAGLTSFGGGLTCLPPWIRTLRRVRLYVHAKLLINAARIRSLGTRRSKTG